MSSINVYRVKASYVSFSLAPVLRRLFGRGSPLVEYEKDMFAVSAVSWTALWRKQSPQHWRVLEIFRNVEAFKLYQRIHFISWSVLEICKMEPAAWLVSFSMWCFQDLDDPISLAHIMFQLGWITYQLVGLAHGLEFQGDPQEFDNNLNLVGWFSRFDPTKLKTRMWETRARSSALHTNLKNQRLRKYTTSNVWLKVTKGASIASIRGYQP